MSSSATAAAAAGGAASANDAAAAPPATAAAAAASAAESPIAEVADLSFPFPALDPWLFCVYHKDDYPAGNPKMEAPRRGNGADFNPRAPYRMYHGDRIPGFPQHPHRGFETVTAVLDGIIDHADSMGNAARYGKGDLQWLTAGRGIVHGEMFPLLNQEEGNPTKFFQIWLNLPAKSKFAEPAFVMHFGSDIPRFKTADGLGVVTLWAGEVTEPVPRRALPPPKDSFASDPKGEVAVIFFHLKPGCTYNLPVARGADVNRVLYIVEGDTLAVNGRVVVRGTRKMLTMRARVPTAVSVPADAAGPTEVLMLQGAPIGEPVAQHGPFVMNTRAEIQQAFADYRRTQFGGWPWPADDQVWPLHDGRFYKQAGKRVDAPPALGELDVTVGSGAKAKDDGATDGGGGGGGGGGGDADASAGASGKEL